MSSLPKNYTADLKYPGYTVMIAPTKCKDCDARSAWCVARRLPRSSSTPPSSPEGGAQRKTSDNVSLVGGKGVVFS